MRVECPTLRTCYYLHSDTTTLQSIEGRETEVIVEKGGSSLDSKLCMITNCKRSVSLFAKPSTFDRVWVDRTT